MKHKIFAVLMGLLIFSSVFSFTGQQTETNSANTASATTSTYIYGSLLWDKTYGGTSYDEANSMVQTSDGGYAMAGRTGSYGAGGYDFWLVKTNSAGNLLWNKTYGGTGDDLAYCLVPTGDGGYALAGYTYSSSVNYYDAWLVKADSSGSQLWNKTYGGGSIDIAVSAIQTGDGGYAFTGATSSYGAGGYDAWLVKTDSLGNLLWNKTYGGTNDDVAYCVIQTGDGGYALAGYTYSFGAGAIDGWLVKTDSLGNLLWNKTYGGTNNDAVFSLLQTSDGGYTLAGTTSSYGAGSYDFWLVKTDSSGSQLWSTTYGGTGDDEAGSVIKTSDGGYALAGYTYSSSANYYDAWLVRTNASGTQLWSKTYGGTDIDEASSVVQTSDGGYMIAGFTGSSGAGGYDFWLIRVSADILTYLDYLTVTSTHGSPNPALGTRTITHNTWVTCSVSTTVTEFGITYKCTGYTGTGSVPSSGSGNSVTFNITQDSTITWTWILWDPTPTPPSSGSSGSSSDTTSSSLSSPTDAPIEGPTTPTIPTPTPKDTPMEIKSSPFSSTLFYAIVIIVVIISVGIAINVLIDLNPGRHSPKPNQQQNSENIVT